MDSNKRARIIESVYSLKKQKTLSFKLDQQIKAKSNFNQRSARESLKKSESFDHFVNHTPSALISPTLNKKNISKFYKSRLLPSQYFQTPQNTLNKLIEKVYIHHRINESPSENFDENIKTLIDEKNKKIGKNSLKEIPEGEFIQNSCRELMNDTKNSKNLLNSVTNYLNNQVKVTKKFINSLERNEENVNFDEFKQKLRLGHRRLTKRRHLTNPEQDILPLLEKY